MSSDEGGDGGETDELELHLMRHKLRVAEEARVRQRVHEQMRERMDTGLRVHTALRAMVTAGRGGRSSANDSGDEAVGACVDACKWCGADLGGGLQPHAACVARMLGWPDGVARQRERALCAVCESPGIETVEQLLCEADVCGNGSCWVFAAMAWFGRVAHAVDAEGRPAQPARDEHGQQLPTRFMSVSASDTHLDRALRCVLHDWMRTHSWAARFAGAQCEEEVDAVVSSVRDVIPYYPVSYSRIGWAWEGESYGSFGGDREYVAAADVLGVAVFTYADWMRGGGHRGRLSMPGEGRRGQRGHGGGAHVHEAIRRCLQAGVPLRFAVNVHGNHWHTLLPLDSDGRVVALAVPDEARPAMEGAALADAAAYVSAYRP